MYFSSEKRPPSTSVGKNVIGTKQEGFASDVKSDRATKIATKQDFVLDTWGRGHKIVNKNWFISLKEIDKTDTDPDGGNKKVLGIEEVEALAKDVKGCTQPLF